MIETHHLLHGWTKYRFGSGERGRKAAEAELLLWKKTWIRNGYSILGPKEEKA